ncbi:hypothetical protein MKX03_031202, partial [Papaver bracteatum]
MALALSFRWIFSWWCQFLTVVITISSKLSLIKDDLIGPSCYPVIYSYGGRSILWYHNLHLLVLNWFPSVTKCINTWLIYIQFYSSIDTSCLPFKHSILTGINNTHIHTMNDHILTMSHPQPNVYHLTNQMESTSIDEQPTMRRVIVHSTHALARGMAEWKFAALGKLYANGELLPKAAERDAKAAWTHLQSPEGQPRNICSKCWVIDHDSNLCSDRRKNRIEAESQLRDFLVDFGQALNIPQQWRHP